MNSQVNDTSVSSGTEWLLSNFVPVTENGVSIFGKPRTIECPYGKAILFNGKKDGIFLEKMPLAGMDQITIEVIFRPDSRGKTEQRFLHIGEISGDRVLMELRSTATDWYLDAFITTSGQQLTLINSELLHPLDQWYHIAFVIDNGKLTTFVNGVKELEGQIDMTPLMIGKTSIGVRQNKVSWFKGAIYKIRITPEVLQPVDFISNNSC